MDISSIKRDMDAINNGEWVDNPNGLNGVSFKVRGFSSDEFEKFLRTNKITEEDDEAREEKTKEGFLNILLLDWKGLTDNGEPIPYSKEIAQQFIYDKSCIDIFSGILEAVQAVDALKINRLDKQKKSSRKA